MGAYLWIQILGYSAEKIHLLLCHKLWVINFGFIVLTDSGWLTDWLVSAFSSTAREITLLKEGFRRATLPNWHIYGQKQFHGRRCQNSKSDKRHLNELTKLGMWMWAGVCADVIYMGQGIGAEPNPSFFLKCPARWMYLKVCAALLMVS